MSELSQRVNVLEWKIRGLVWVLVLAAAIAVTMGAALTSSDTSGPYANGQQRITDLTTAAAGQNLTVPDRTQLAAIQAIGGVVYFSHDDTFATATDFQIAAGDIFFYDGDVTSVNLLAAGADTDVNVLYFR